MERDAWVREYRRLLSAFNRTPNNEQVDVYFAALSAYPSVSVTEAVTQAIRESRSWPSAADLVDRARLYLAGHQAPATMCDVCHGERFTQHVCEVGLEPNEITKPACGACGCFHEKARGAFHYARRCYQCHPAAKKDSAA